MSSKFDFDAAAATWDDNPRRVQLAQTVAQTIRQQIPLRPDMQLLDYGCGTGLVALALQPFVGSVIAADSSLGMLQKLQEKIRAAGLTNVTTRQLDLESQDWDGPPVDVIVSSMTFHHLQNPQAVLRKMAALLAPGGFVAVADLDADSEGFHSDKAGVLHEGFSAQQMKEMFSTAGLEDIHTVEVGQMERESQLFRVLLTMGRKP